MHITGNQFSSRVQKLTGDLRLRLGANARVNCIKPQRSFKSSSKRRGRVTMWGALRCAHRRNKVHCDRHCKHSRTGLSSNGSVPARFPSRPRAALLQGVNHVSNTAANSLGAVYPGLNQNGYGGRAFLLTLRTGKVDQMPHGAVACDMLSYAMLCCSLLRTTLLGSAPQSFATARNG